MPLHATPAEQAAARVAAVVRESSGISALYSFAIEAERGRLEAVEVLRGVEWDGADGDSYAGCPWCGATYLPESPQHDPTCRLAAVLAGER